MTILVVYQVYLRFDWGIGSAEGQRGVGFESTGDRSVRGTK